MKKVIASVFILFNIVTAGMAKETRINLYGGYVFDDKFDSYYDPYNYYNGKIQGGFQYGAGVELMAHPSYGFELLYIGQSTKVPTYYYSTGYTVEKYSVFDLNLNYAMIAGTRHLIKPEGKIEGYGGFGLGALFVSAKNPETGASQSSTKFAWMIRLGANFWMSHKVGIKLQTQLISAVQGVGGQLYFGSGGSGAGLTTYSSMLQFGFTGGLVFRFGETI